MAALRRTDVTQQRHYAAIQDDDLRIKGIQRGIREANLYKSNATSDERVLYKRNARTWAMEEAQRGAAKKRDDEINRRATLRQKHDQEEALANTLSRMQDAEMSASRRRQLLHEAPEIRDLKRHLEAAHVSKGIYNQRAEKEEAAKTALMSRRLEAEGSLAETRRMQQDANEATLRKQAEQSMYAGDLQRQLDELEQAQLRELQLKQVEAEQIDRIIELVREEDAARERDATTLKMTRLQEEEDFLAERDGLRAARAEESRRMDQVAAEQAKQLDSRNADQKTAKARAFAALEQLQEQLAAAVREKQESADEIERIQQELYQEEMLEKLLVQQQAEDDKRERQREEQQADHHAYQMQKQQMAARLEAEDMEFKRAMMEKFARDDRLEQLSAQKRRMKSVAHGREVSRMMEERKARQLFEAQQRRDEHQRELEAEEVRRDVIESERRRILAEYMAKEDLVGHIAKGVIQDDDVGLLPESMRAAYTRRPSDDDFDDY